ncbi:protein Fe65 homolog isoform X3 [Varroa destructor]|uniref:Uncharacterized protein n=1 Tax=Varroa destructor TaxID=109461 RepID=A0A7M7J5R7_VARDE|nr:protein Fe65 homolog isoform X3 [Varroa destructor]
MNTVDNLAYANLNLVNNQNSNSDSTSNYNVINNNNNVAASVSTLTTSLSGRELASAERRSGVSSTPCTPQSQRHVRSRRKDATGVATGISGLHFSGHPHVFGPQGHATGGATALLKGTAFETNGNLASSGGGSLTSLTGSPALKRRGDSTKGMDKSSANFLDYYLSLESAVRQKREASGEQIPPVSAAPSTDNAISVANTNSPSGDHNREKAADETPEKSVKPDTAEVPTGWEKHEDDEGAYYWHIATGTIQREMPTVEGTDKLTAQHKRLAMPTAVAFRNKNGNASEKVLKRQSCPILTRRAIEQMIQSNQKKPIRFAVRSLGWLEVPEEELTPDKSSRAVNTIIQQLGAAEQASGGMNVVSNTNRSRNDRWGGGIDIYMDIDDECLRLIDPNKIKSKIVEIDDLCTDDDVVLGGLSSLAFSGASAMSEEIGDEDECILLEQPIHTIRMWGVGRDKDRDFAYVARDRVNKNVVLCHVFRCDMPARIIATTLRDACKRAMIERGLVVKRDKSTALPEERKNKRFSDLLLGADSFPQPSEEINKTLKALYVGSIEVSKPEGMDMLISAIDRLVSVVPPYRYRPVKVTVTTSAVTVRPQDNEREVVFDARVRFIEYIGMGRQEEMCSLVVDPNPGSTTRRFVAHVFHCEPTAAALTKALEAAYKLRYQKCLDAHSRPQQPLTEQLPFNPNHGRAPVVTRSSSISQIGCTLRNVFSQTLRLVGSQTSNHI